MDINVVLVIVTVVVLLIFMIVMIFIMNQNNLRQQLYLQDALNQSEKNKDAEMDILKAQISDSLLLFQNTMTSSIKGDLNYLNETTVNRLSHIENKVNDSLLQGFNKTNESFSSILQQMVKVSATQENLKGLASNIENLQNVLTDKKTRGTFGEVELYSILENVFGQNDSFFERQYKLSNGNIADCVLFAPEPIGKIVIDSKFPLENFNRLYEESNTQSEQVSYRNAFRKDVKKHIDDIAFKYLIPNETAEIAYMFLPAEAIFAEVYGHYDDIVQYSYRKKVYIVSPTTLMAYLTVIKSIYVNKERNEKVVEIQEEFSKLATEFARFESRYSNVSKDFEKTYKEMQEVSITASKIVNRFNQIQDMDLGEKDKGSNQDE